METKTTLFGNNWVRSFLSISWSYFCFFYFTLFAVYPIPAPNQNAVHIILGFLIGIPILGFYYQTTQGSQEATRMLAASQPVPDKSVTVSETNNTEVK